MADSVEEEEVAEIEEGSAVAEEGVVTGVVVEEAVVDL